MAKFKRLIPEKRRSKKRSKKDMTRLTQNLRQLQGVQYPVIPIGELEFCKRGREIAKYVATHLQEVAAENLVNIDSKISTKFGSKTSLLVSGFYNDYYLTLHEEGEQETKKIIRDEMFEYYFYQTAQLSTHSLKENRTTTSVEFALSKTSQTQYKSIFDNTPNWSTIYEKFRPLASPAEGCLVLYVTTERQNIEIIHMGVYQGDDKVHSKFLEETTLSIHNVLETPFYEATEIIFLAHKRRETV